MYKVRCSSLATLIAGCGKDKTGKFEWSDLDKMNESHIKLAIKIYNEHHGFIEEDYASYDLESGTKQEPDAIKMYDKHFKTNFFEGYVKSREEKGDKPFDKFNDWITGSRDFGDDNETIDCKVSTNKNTFNAKAFAPVELNYTIQMNGYSWLYGTPKLTLFNALMNPLQEQLDSMVKSKIWVCKLGLLEEQNYRERLESSYFYDFLPLRSRIQIKEVPLIPNFQDIVKKRVETMNKWIELNKSSL